MRQQSTALAFAIGVAALCFAATPARSQTSTDARCPAGYWLMESLCLNNTTGDVVNASPAATLPAASERGCAPGYWRLDSLCLSPSTGDVELADEQRWPMGATSAGRR